ncbi:unnamed protein product [Linum trigynum]|uniref:Uncharacterized protein n=1 Tax=Linum trigynum TaxID=586398 RepID=A0AAV2ERF6_9ROSI
MTPPAFRPRRLHWALTLLIGPIIVPQAGKASGFWRLTPRSGAGITNRPQAPVYKPLPPVAESGMPRLGIVSFA